MDGCMYVSTYRARIACSSAGRSRSQHRGNSPWWQAVRRCLLEACHAVLSDVVAEGGLSLFALRMALQPYLGLDLTARKSDIRHCAELCLRQLTSGSDNVSSSCNATAF